MFGEKIFLKIVVPQQDKRRTPKSIYQLIYISNNTP